MKRKKLDGVEVWKEFEDVAARLGLNLIERAVYSHLLRHTRLEGKLRLRFSITGLAAKLRLSRGPVRKAIRRLSDLGALRFVERGYSGHLLEVRLPAEVPAARRKTGTSSRPRLSAELNLEELDFMRRKLRQAIHAREGGQCFYCRRRVPGRSLCLDHVVPCARSGQNSYRRVARRDRGAAPFGFKGAGLIFPLLTYAIISFTGRRASLASSSDSGRVRGSLKLTRECDRRTGGYQ